MTDKTNTLRDDVGTVIEKANRLINIYKSNIKRHEKNNSPNMAISTRGSIIGLVALLSQITDKNAEDYFREIFPEEYKDD